MCASRTFKTPLARKAGGAAEEKKKEKCKNKKYILKRSCCASLSRGYISRKRSPHGSGLGPPPSVNAALRATVKKKTSWRSWSQYPPLPPIFYENTAVYAHWPKYLGPLCHDWILVSSCRDPEAWPRGYASIATGDAHSFLCCPRWSSNPIPSGCQPGISSAKPKWLLIRLPLMW